MVKHRVKMFMLWMCNNESKFSVIPTFPLYCDNRKLHVCVVIKMWEFSVKLLLWCICLYFHNDVASYTKCPMFRKQNVNPINDLNGWWTHDETWTHSLPFIFWCMQVSKNIVMEAHFIRPAHFTGITCTAYQRREVSTGSLGMETSESTHEQQLRFRCSTGSHNTSLNHFPLKVSLKTPYFGC